MSVELLDIVETLVDIPSERDPSRSFPAGTRGTVVHLLHDPRQAYIVDLPIPNAGKGEPPTEDVILLPDQLRLVWSFPGRG
jgi:hypothetical protein